MLTHHANRQLRSYMTKEGNWRMKGLMLAAFEGGETVGSAWPTNPSEKEKSRRRALADGGAMAASNTPPAQETYSPTVAGETRELSAARSHYDEKELEEGVDKDKYIKRMLLNETHEELDVLWREELLSTVIAGAEPRQIARDASQVINVGTRKGDIPRGSAQVYAPTVAEGAEIPTDEENFETVPFNARKYAQGFGVTDELIDMANPDVIERNIRFTGAAIENSINREWLNELVDSAAETHNVDYAGGGDLSVGGINAAAGAVEMNDFGPADTLVMHPQFKTELFDDSNLAYANQSGSEDVLNNRSFNNIMGMTLYTGSDGTYNSGANAWGFDAAGDVGAVAYQREQIGTIIYRDVETKDFSDPIRDIQGGNARAYADVAFLQPGAAATITY